MAVDPSVRIDIAAEFTGKKAFKQADTSTAQLSKNVKNLAKTFGVAFSVTKVLAYAKASVKAAAADQKAQQQLALALKNVGLGRDAATAEGYIQRIEKEFGIVDDKLRPAYSRLAIATRDTAETQRLMGIAMDISASTGKDLDSVTSALSKAYLGSNTALSKLSVGISKADLATKSFDKITKQLSITFAGAAVKSADSVSGSMDKLAIATNNAKETIGVGLLTAFSNLAGNGDVDQAVSKIDSVAASLSKMIVVASKLKWYDWVIGGITGGTITDITKFKGMGNIPLTGGSNMDTQKADAVAKKAAAAKIAADKKAAANKIKFDKMSAANAAKLAKAAAVFEIQKIQIAAALKGKISEEERTRLLLMQAIAEGNADKAEILQKKLEQIQKQTADIAADLLAIGEATNPFSTWSGSLAATLIELNKVGERMFAIRQKESGYVDTSILGGGAAAGGTTFDQDATPSQVLAIVETAAKAAEVAATEAVASVQATQTNTDALAASAEAALELATILNVNSDIAQQAQSSSMYNPYAMGEEGLLFAQAMSLLQSGSNAGAGTSSSMFNPFATTPGSSSGYGTQAPTIIVNNNGSVIMQDEFIDVVNDAVLASQRFGYGRTPAGAIL